MNLSLEDEAKATNKALKNAKVALLEAILAEKEGNFEKSVQLYQKCYKMCPDLDTKTIDTIEIEGIQYDLNGNKIESNFVADYQVSYDCFCH